MPMKEIRKDEKSTKFKTYYVVCLQSECGMSLDVKSHFVSAKDDLDMLNFIKEENLGLVLFFKEIKQ